MTLALDDELVTKAQALTGLEEKSALVREALKALIERESARRLARLEEASPSFKPGRVDGRSLHDPHRHVGLGRSPAGRRQDGRDIARSGRVLAHPFVIGELALGHLRQRQVILSALQDLPQANAATDTEVLLIIERHTLMGIGISYVDAHLLASTRLTTGAALWMRDGQMLGVAERLGLGWSEGSASDRRSPRTERE
jgi:Arc/MetJ family transcription regulator